jgi:hypothetical protein
MSAEKDREPVSGVSSQAMVPAGAVFLSYASEDGPAAERIAAALRRAGIEVWFDKSELRGGDTWDRQIRKQIHDCRVFIAVISAHTEARDEGYFRREWRLAVERAGDMAEGKAFPHASEQRRMFGHDLLLLFHGQRSRVSGRTR